MFASSLKGAHITSQRRFKRGVYYDPVLLAAVNHSPQRRMSSASYLSYCDKRQPPA
jgi:hypothetical protein